MRIRKRKEPIPLSSLSPIPLSDPHLHRSPVVQLQFDTDPQQILLQEDDTAAYFNSPLPSDQPIGGNSNIREEKKVLVEDGQMMKGEEGEGEEENSNDTRKEGVLGAQTQETTILLQSSSSHQVGRWYEGEKAFPLKKRRGSFARRLNNEAMNMEKDRKMKTKMKTKMNMKCNVEENGIEDEEEGKKAKEGCSNGSSGAKKKARGGALMEGSRCSRVNGRGWRCCQQTLVGYSLCEHHLGKGRLRSMTSVRSRSMASAAPKKAHADPLPLSSISLSIEEKGAKHTIPDNNANGKDDQDGEKKPMVIGKKKMKLGMVKARSISSLLGQRNNAIAVAENDVTGNT